MPRTPVLSFDRGTLLLHPPPKGKAWVDYATWDDRVEKFRIPAIAYPQVIQALQTDGVELDDQARLFQPIELVPRLATQP